MHFLLINLAFINLACTDSADSQLEGMPDWCQDSQYVTIERVFDGDTVEFNDPELGMVKVRLLGVAAPEIDTPDAPEECFGNESWWFLEDLILGQEVKLEYDVDCTDLYGRQLAWVQLIGNDPITANYAFAFQQSGLNADGSYEILVNELLVRLGYATMYDGELDPSIRYTPRIETAEALAEADNLGGWAECTDF